MKKMKVGILGATGAVGQQFIALLDQHPWFEVSALAASEKSAGKLYREAANWILPSPIPHWAAAMNIISCRPELECDFVFSGLDAKVAGEIEMDFAKAGIPVISNARNHRYDPLVPLLIPEVNPDHIHIIQKQQQHYGFKNGFIVTNPNCSTIGLVLGVLPIWQKFGIQKMVVTTLQAISGAGYPGVASLDILGNVIPFISGEVEKIQTEPLKLFGSLGEKQIHPAEFVVSAQCNRIAVRDGHLISVSLQLDKESELQEVEAAYQQFQSHLIEWNLPSAPDLPVQLHQDPLRPQPYKDSQRGNGMIVTVGQLQRCPVLDIRLVAVVHNTIRGAAGCAILNAEWLRVKGYF